RRDRFWRWVRRDLNNRHECWLGPCPSIGHFAVVACYPGVHLPPPREQQAAVDPILPRHLGDIGSLRETLGQDPSLILRRPAPPAPATRSGGSSPHHACLDAYHEATHHPPVQETGAQSTARRTSARWDPHAAIASSNRSKAAARGYARKGCHHWLGVRSFHQHVRHQERAYK